MILSAVAVILAAGALVASLAIPGPLGPQGATGATGATGSQGPAGTDYTINTTLQSGQNETGLYSAWGGGASSYFASNVNFRIPLAADLPAAKVAFIAQGSPYTVDCPGPGQARAGFLCVYELTFGLRTFGGLFNPTTGLDGASRYGFSIYFTATAGSSWSYGQWTVAAP